MGPTEHLINAFTQRGHPLGQAIDEDEVAALIDTLRLRLGATADELDLSPASLTTLEQRLISLYQTLKASGKTLAEDDLVQLVRGIAAYVGRVLVVQAQGQWRTVGNSLWGTEVVFLGPVLGVKDSGIRSYSKRVFSLGNIAASAWDAVVAGVSPNLYQNYHDARTKKLRERLPRRN